MKILVAGGAGYVGSHAVRVLLEDNLETIVLDNLVHGHEKALPKEIKLIKGDIGNTSILNKIFTENKIDLVMHFASYINVGESVKDPKKYFENNVVNSLNLVNSMITNKVLNIVFSSTAAVYGTPDKVPITEKQKTQPINPYGETKLIFENILKNYNKSYGLNYICLRYFNASGAGYNIGEYHNPETHLIPLVLQTALGLKEYQEVFGTDYDTPDGTAIRDYIHVMDIAEAHLLAAKYLIETKQSDIFNLGSSEGNSVKQIIEASKRITGIDIKVKENPRREGDPSILVADYKKIKNKLGWAPKRDINEIIRSAWEWHKNNPKGFQ